MSRKNKRKHTQRTDTPAETQVSALDNLAATFKQHDGRKKFTREEVDALAQNIHSDRIIPKDALAAVILPMGGENYEWCLCAPLGESLINPTHMNKIFLNIATNDVWKEMARAMGEEEQSPVREAQYTEPTENEDGSISF